MEKDIKEKEKKNRKELRKKFFGKSFKERIDDD